MKKLITLALIVASGVVFAQFHTHVWMKDGEYEDNLGQKVCVWKCCTAYPCHTTTTSGYGFCSQPMP